MGPEAYIVADKNLMARTLLPDAWNEDAFSTGWLQPSLLEVANPWGNRHRQQCAQAERVDSREDYALWQGSVRHPNVRLSLIGHPVGDLEDCTSSTDGAHPRRS